jgi:hypothetical protein
MASSTPQGKKSVPGWEPFDAKAFFEYLREMGPQPELADAIEEAYKERHRGFSEGPRGRTQRRRSTPK